MSDLPAVRTSLDSRPEHSRERRLRSFILSCYAPMPTSAPHTSALMALVTPSTPANGSCLWRNCPGISAHASAARPWPLWRGCKRKGLSVFLFSDMVSWSNSRFAAGGVTTRFSTTMRPVRRIPAFLLPCIYCHRAGQCRSLLGDGRHIGSMAEHGL